MRLFLLFFFFITFFGCSSKATKVIKPSEIFLSRAEEFLNKKDYVEYYKHISFHLMNEAPFDIAIRLRAATIFEKIEDKTKALAFYEEVLKLDSQNYDALLGKIRCAVSKEESLGMLNYFLSIYSGNTEGLLLRAAIFEEKKSWSFAKEDYETVLTKEKTNISSLYGMARVFQAQEKYVEAYNIVAEIIQNYSKETSAYILRLSLLQKLGKDLETQIAFNEFINKFPDNLVVRFNYGEFLLNKNQLSEAKDQFEYIKKLDPFHPMTNFYLGKIYIDQGQIGKAGMLFKELYDNNSGEAWVAKSYSKILAYVGQEKKSIQIASSIQNEEVLNPPVDNGFTDREVAASSINDHIIIKIKKGDSLQSLSKTFYGTTKFWKMLMDFNKIKSRNLLKIGLKIKIPNRAE